jgi:hypothetical protein
MFQQFHSFLLSQCCDDKIASVGGIELWNKLLKEEKEVRQSTSALMDDLKAS